MVEWQCQDKASIHRKAKEFADDRKRVHEWCQYYSTLKGQTRGVLGNATVFAVANLCKSILTIEFLEDERSEGRSMSNQLLSVCNICSYVNNLAWPWKRGCIHDKCQILHISSPMLSTSAKVAKRGGYAGHYHYY